MVLCFVCLFTLRNYSKLFWSSDCGDNITILTRASKTYIVSCDGCTHKFWTLFSIPQRNLDFRNIYLEEADGRFAAALQEFISNHKEPVSSSYGNMDTGLRSAYTPLSNTAYPSSSLSSQHYSGRYGSSGIEGYSNYGLWKCRPANLAYLDFTFPSI